MSAATNSQGSIRLTSESASPVGLVISALSSLVPAIEPQLVFSQALKLCAPQLCDFGSVELIEADEQSYFVCWPAPEPMALAAQAVLRRTDEHSIVEHTVYTPIRVVTDDPKTSYHGVLSLRYDSITPGATEALIGQLVVERVVAVIGCERLRLEAETERTRAEHLERALESSRDIGTALGILMASQKCRTEAAFAQLRAVSQNTHRKIRDIAQDVIDTGMLDTGSSATS